MVQQLNALVVTWACSRYGFFWEPLNWQDVAECKRHRYEVKAFAEMLWDSETKVVFVVSIAVACGVGVPVMLRGLDGPEDPPRRQRKAAYRAAGTHHAFRDLH